MIDLGIIIADNSSNSSNSSLNKIYVLDHEVKFLDGRAGIYLMIVFLCFLMPLMMCIASRKSLSDDQNN